MGNRVLQDDGKHYCVYRLLDENNKVLYIGKSEQLKIRIVNHIRGKSNIPDECCKKIKRVEFLEFETEADMDLFEIYAISYYQPPYNKEGVSKLGLIRIEIPKVWNELLIDSFYKIIKTDVIKSSQEEVDYTEVELDMGDFHFDKHIFTNEQLAIFLTDHFDKNTISR